MNRFVFSILIAVFVECSPNNTTTSVGYFKDSHVSGLRYVSSSWQGVTDDLGSFQFEHGESVSFYLGNLLVGQTTADNVLTPVELVSDGDSENSKVLNRVRLFMLLDEDEDPSNGIKISESVSVLAENWESIDLNTDDFENEIQVVRDDLRGTVFEERTLATEQQARTHLESTIRCANSGAFKGEYSSADDEGSFGMLVDAQTGLISSVAYSRVDDSYGYYEGVSSVSFDQTSRFESRNEATGISIQGTLQPLTVNGNWFLQDAKQGEFNGKRMGGAFEAKYRFTGQYELNGGQGHGLFSFDVDANDQITGIAYNLQSDELLDLSGEVYEGSLVATSTDGTRITGTMDKNTGRLEGDLGNPEYGFAGTFNGNGCKLN